MGSKIKFLTVASAVIAFLLIISVAAAGTFLALTDTPSSYTGQAGKYAKVNSGESALEFDTPPGTTDHSALSNLNWASAGHTIDADLDFDGNKAVAMVLDSGSAVPASAHVGQPFMHTPTGRTIFMVYDGSSWVPIISLGAMTVYVDNTDGTDSVDYGGTVDSGAFKTIQYAINQVPTSYSGDVTIQVSAGDYNEALQIRGKFATVSCHFMLKGTLSEQETVSSATVAAGTGATQGTVTKAGAFTGDNYANLLCYFVTDDEYRVIDSHTNDTLTVVATAPSSTTQDIKIYDWGTTVNYIDVTAGQTAIQFYGMKFDTATGIISNYGSKVQVYTTLVDVDSAYGIYSNGGYVLVYDSYITTANYQATDCHGGYLELNRTKVYTESNGDRCIRVADGGSVSLKRGSILDASSTTNTRGVELKSNSTCNCYASAAVGYVRIRNQNIGIDAYTGSQVINTVNVQYSGNTIDEQAEAASFAAID